MFERRHWIPPAGLIFAQLCHGLSWVLALWIAAYVGIRSFSGAHIAWIHLVALGWFSVAAFSILLHAIPAFTDVTWRFETAARWALAAAASAVAFLVVSFLAWPQCVGIAASLLGAALAVYLVTAWFTLGRAFASPDRVDRAVGRAFAMTLIVFAVVVLLGIALAWMLSGANVPIWFARLPGAHANLAFFGWLTLLVFGVSARTLRPITGKRSRWPKLHVVVGSAMLLGAPVLAAGVALGNPWPLWIGAALVAIAVDCYIADVADILIRATVPNRPPQAFVAAALVWLAAALFLGLGVLLGAPWRAAFGFVFLVGWVGQMVNAHTLHIGVRLIATIYRGDEDETPPGELLGGRWSWSIFGLMQIAVLAVAAGLIGNVAASCSIGAAAGLAGWAVMLAALARARVLAGGRRLRSLAE